jgi:hypothetical protein
MLSHYIIIRRDLSPGLRLAYAVHAAGESVAETVPEGTRAVVLAVRDEGSLDVYDRLLSDSSVAHKVIREDGQALAIGIEPTAELDSIRRLLSSLPLAQ